MKRIPVGAVSPTAASSLSELSPGQVLTIDLSVNEQVTGSRLALVEDFAKQGAVEIPEGMMEVTISLGSEQTIGGTLTAGEKVALALTLEDETGVVLHKMLVTHVQGAPVVSAQESTAVDSNERPPGTGRQPARDLRRRHRPAPAGRLGSRARQCVAGPRAGGSS